MRVFEQGGARYLMCRPEHFAVNYVINPWMDPQSWARDTRAHAAAVHQWADLARKLGELGATIDLVPAAPGLPDLVFTANAAIVLDRKALLARFRHPERQREEPHFEMAFHALQARGVIEGVHKLPDGIVLEGAGDCVWDATRKQFWLGYGQRSDAAAAQAVSGTFGQAVVPLELADARFYHMDTALSVLPHGEVMYLPEAFTAAGCAEICDRIAPSQRIELDMVDGARLAANAVCLGNAVIMSDASDRLARELAERGYQVVTTPLSAFLRSGGSAFCLTLRLDRRSVLLAPALEQAAVA